MITVDSREVPNAASGAMDATPIGRPSPGQTDDQACWIAGGTWLLHQRVGPALTARTWIRFGVHLENVECVLD